MCLISDQKRSTKMKIYTLVTFAILLSSLIGFSANVVPKGDKKISRILLEGDSFRSSATIHILPPKPNRIGNLEKGLNKIIDAINLLGSEKHLKASTTDLLLNPQDIKKLQKKVKVEQIEGTDLVVVSVFLGDKIQSQKLANRISETFLKDVGKENAVLIKAAELGKRFKKK